VDEPTDIGRWLDATVDALSRGTGSDVPCGDCTACCSASQFVHVDPDESGALARIPADLLFPAPGLPPGHVLLGYDEHGRCPMLSPAGCTIYDDRPRACRAYDCRVFAVTGVVPDELGKAGIAARVAGWRFVGVTEADRTRWAAVQAAAAFLAADERIAGMSSTALRCHALFLGRDGVVEPDADHVVALLGLGTD
jgi:Fe-S-cluster containining protein